MAGPAPTARMTYAEYRAAEAVAEVRHEFLNGEVWERAGVAELEQDWDRARAKQPLLPVEPLE